MWNSSFRLRSAIACALVALTGATAASAQSVVSTGQSFVSGKMLPGARQADGSQLAGLRLTLSDGWKTYWRSPGDAGIPPLFDWEKSKNVAKVEIYWPRPGLFNSFGLRTIGYADRVTFPVHIVPEDPAKPVDLVLHARVGVCRDICVIEDFELSELIEPDQRAVGTAEIERAMSRVPAAGEDEGLTGAACHIAGNGKDRAFKAQLSFDHVVKDPMVIVEGDGQFWVRKTETQSSDGNISVTAEIGVPKEVTWIDRSTIRMTVLAGDFAADIRGCTALRG